MSEGLHGPSLWALWPIVITLTLFGWWGWAVSKGGSALGAAIALVFVVGGGSAIAWAVWLAFSIVRWIQ